MSVRRLSAAISAIVLSSAAALALAIGGLPGTASMTPQAMVLSTATTETHTTPAHTTTPATAPATSTKPTLPKTGPSSTTGLLLGGAIVLLIGIGLVGVARNRRKQQG